VLAAAGCLPAGRLPARGARADHAANTSRLRHAATCRLLPPASGNRAPRQLPAAPPQLPPSPPMVPQIPFVAQYRKEMCGELLVLGGRDEPRTVGGDKDQEKADANYPLGTIRVGGCAVPGEGGGCRMCCKSRTHAAMPEAALAPCAWAPSWPPPRPATLCWFAPSTSPCKLPLLPSTLPALPLCAAGRGAQDPAVRRAVRGARAGAAVARDASAARGAAGRLRKGSGGDYE
jgi:hypothetical protein